MTDGRLAMADTCVLTVNTGSSSVKLALYPLTDLYRPRIVGQVERIGSPRAAMTIVAGGGEVLAEERLAAGDHEDGVRSFIAWLGANGFDAVAAIGHRVVHGGPDHVDPEPITPRLLADLRALAALDPDHEPAALAAISSAGHAYPGVPQFACFDTAFHRSMPWVARAYALPAIDPQLRRYGFHGLSCESIVEAMTRIAPEAVHGRLIVAHLGSGASMTAVRDGVGIDTTMGLSPTGGLVMSTRCGDLDPSVLVYLAAVRQMAPERIRRLVNKESGLLGVSGLSGDMRDLLAREPSDEAAARAVALFCYAARKFLGALVAALGGLDTLVFTGGIGEHAADVRQRICADLDCLGIDLDDSRNSAHAAVISSRSSRVTVRVMRTDEDGVIARHVRRLLAQPGVEHVHF